MESARIPAKSVGTPKKKVGFSSRSSRTTDCGVGRSASSTELAPAANGKVIALPSPYAKKSLAAEKTTSSARIRRMPSPYNRAVSARSPCRCIAPFGWPVEPLE